MLGAYVVAAQFLWPEFDAIGDVLLAGLYLTDYSYPHFDRPEILNHTWSLAVEAQFYLLWPFVVFSLARTERRCAMAILAGLFLAATLWRWHVAMDASGWAGWSQLYYRFDMRLSGLVLGSLLAFGAFDLGKRPAEILGGISLLLISILAANVLWRSAMAIMLQPVVDVAAAGLVAALASRSPNLLKKILSARPAVYLGLLSYSIYLWHYPIIRMLRGHDWIIVAAAGAVLSLAVAQLSYTALESPLRRYRHSQRGKEKSAATCGSQAAA